MIPAKFPVGTLVAESKTAPASEAEPKVELAIETVGQPTVGELIQFLLDKEMDRYNFDDTGSGCLYWVWTGIQHLQDAGLVESRAVEALDAFHTEQTRLHPERFSVPIRRGTFY